MKRFYPAFFVLLLAACLAGAQDSQDKIASVRIEGNQRIATETYLYYISAKPGQTYDESTLRSDFKRLWQTGFLNDLKIETEETPLGIDVIFRVAERPLIKAIEYTGNKKVSQSDIETKLKDENINIRLDQPFDPNLAQKAANAINKVMAEKGLQFGSATYKTEPLGNTASKVVFVIDEGPKASIGEILFDGNQVFSDSKLRGQMKDIKEHGMFSWITKKDDFEKEKFEKDMERVEEFYFNNGYINARIEEPKTELLPNKKRMRITIPVHEGKQFRTGDISFSGNTVFQASQLLPKIPLKKGKIFNRKLLRDGIEEIQKMYGNEGYIYVSIGPVFDVKEQQGVVDLKMETQENGQFFVNRIEFTGNDFTRDKVIRRELLLQEGDLLRVNKFRESIDRIYRLGFFEDLKPNITPVAEESNQADISIDVKENRRNEIRLGGGYSELEGFFGDIVFSTKNLFGSGKIFTINLQSGSRTKNYAFQILEPYFMDTRLSIGIGASKSQQRYLFYNFLQEQIGGNVSFGYQNIIGEFDAGVSYGYAVINTEPISGDTLPSDNIFPGPNVLLNDRTESRIIPSLVRSTVNNPLDPSEGTRFVISHEISGGILGGDLSYYKPVVTFTQYIPLHGPRHVAAYNVEVGYGTGIAGEEFPFYRRYYLGGEQSIRGYDVGIVAPIAVDPVTQRQFVVRGNKYFLVNAEYIMAIAGPLKVAGFVDYGNAFLEGESLDFTDMRGSTGLELRFLAPFLSTPFRFIYAFNFNRGELLTLPAQFQPKRTVFRFSVGTTF